MSFISDFMNYLSNFFGDSAIAISMVILFLVFILILIKSLVGTKKADNYVTQEDHQALQEALDNSINELKTLLYEVMKRQKQGDICAQGKRGRPKGGKSA